MSLPRALYIHICPSIYTLRLRVIDATYRTLMPDAKVYRSQVIGLMLLILSSLRTHFDVIQHLYQSLVICP